VESSELFRQGGFSKFLLKRRAFVPPDDGG
jgi:hypothetical protein